MDMTALHVNPKLMIAMSLSQALRTAYIKLRIRTTGSECEPLGQNANHWVGRISMYVCRLVSVSFGFSFRETQADRKETK